MKKHLLIIAILSMVFLLMIGGCTNKSSTSNSPTISTTIIPTNISSQGNNSITSSEQVIFVGGVSITAGNNITFAGNATLPDGTKLQSQLYEDNKALDWWPTTQDIQIQNKHWQLVVQLGINGAPNYLQTGPGYTLKIWSKNNPEIMAGFYFDLVGPPISEHPVNTP